MVHEKKSHTIQREEESRWLKPSQTPSPEHHILPMAMVSDLLTYTFTDAYREGGTH